MKILEWVIKIVLWLATATLFVLIGWMLRASKQRVVDQANHERSH